MFHFLKKVILLFIFAALIIFYLKIPIRDIRKAADDISAKISHFEEKTVLPSLSKIKQEIFAPPPLNFGHLSQGGNLSVEKVIELTNAERLKVGSRTLRENSTLDRSAGLKLKDMFDYQYFDHVSPSGRGPAGLAGAVGYRYILIGENLALGNFENNEALVVAWMASPGHRANILNGSYTEIGVAVGKGVYEGKETWIAVQEFGLPQSACPLPDEKLKTQIDSVEQTLAVLKNEISARAKKVEALSPRDSDYSHEVDSYNTLVAEYNKAVDLLKIQIAKYNTQVEATNACRAAVK